MATHVLPGGAGEEPLTQEDPDRFTILPLKYPGIWAWYKKMEHQTWVAQDADLSLDRKHWDLLSPGERVFYGYIFGMFGGADEKIIRNLAERFASEFTVKEAIYFYNQQTQNEGVHSEAYSLQIETLYDGEEKEAMFRAALNMPVVGKMMAWADAWIGSAESLGVRVAAFAVFEGVLFQGQFLALQLLKNRNIMPGVTTLNELISRDEGTHCLFACYLLVNHIQHRPTLARVHQIVGEAVGLFDEFIASAIADAKKADGLADTDSCPVPHVAEEKMKQYVRFVADGVSVDMGYPALYGVSNPYPETVKLSLNEVLKTNFFENVTTQYSAKVDYTFTANPRRCVPVGLGVSAQVPARYVV